MILKDGTFSRKTRHTGILFDLEMLIHMLSRCNSTRKKKIEVVLTKNAIPRGEILTPEDLVKLNYFTLPNPNAYISPYIETLGIPYSLSNRFPKLQETILPSPGFRRFIRMPSSNSAKKAVSKSLIRRFRDFSVPMGITI